MRHIIKAQPVYAVKANGIISGKLVIQDKLLEPKATYEVIITKIKSK